MCLHLLRPYEKKPLLNYLTYKTGNIKFSLKTQNPVNDGKLAVIINGEIHFPLHILLLSHYIHINQSGI